MSLAFPDTMYEEDRLSLSLLESLKTLKKSGLAVVPCREKPVINGEAEVITIQLQQSCFQGFSLGLGLAKGISLKLKSSSGPGKGGKNRRRGKNENETEKRELVFKEDGQEYAQVTKMLGNGRLEAMCFDGNKRLCHIRGKLRKKARDIILVGLRDYQDAKADVILKYNPDEARNLKAYGEIPETAKINENIFVEEGLDEDITFEEGYSEGEGEIEN
ncbi:unnamed protein product, partial [Darwinula stevensoni]